MTIATLEAISTQQKHMDILEVKLLEAQIRLQRMREEQEEIIQMIIRDNR